MAAEDRQTKLTISLGEQVLLERVECVEALGQPFTMVIDVYSTLGDLDMLQHLGKPVSVKVLEDDRPLRDFHGIVTESELMEEGATLGFHYRLIARPFTYYMAQNRDYAIFQDKDAKAIIGEVFNRRGYSDFRFTDSKPRQKREYCVQYGESDFAFISRLMEDEGLYYYYEHAPDKHVMVICEAPSSHTGSSLDLVYNPETTGVFNTDSAARSDNAKNYLQKWTERITSNAETKVTLRDFNLETPNRPVEGKAEDKPEHPRDKQEVFVHPGHFGKDGDGNTLAGYMLDGLRHDRRVYTGESQSSAVACGHKVRVKEFPADRLNIDYLVTRTYHSIVSEGYRSGGDDPEEIYNVRFEAIPATTQFRMPAVTPRPRVLGMESAIVSGPKGEEIYTDKYGRVKVRFHWDRSGSAGESSTCWVRVAQFGNLGSFILPRIDQEVMIDFLHGDPDHPVVCGWVFNESHKPAYALPDNKTRSVWRTRSTKQGGPTNANELRFEDKKGSEEVFFRAEKDMNILVLHNQTNHVDVDHDIKVGGYRTDFVQKDETTEIKQNQKLKVGGKQDEEIVSDRTIKVKSNDSLEVSQNIKVKANMSINVEAMKEIVFVVGQSKITIDQMGVKVEGMMLKTEAQIMHQTKSLMTQNEASAIQILKGAITMIN